jgi:multiple sugar transport system ATP-binding protein
MRLELSRLHQRLGKTMIYVTHDQVEAMTLADRIVVFNRGVIQQVGTPLELYDAPSNLFVATFIGSPRMNLIPCRPAADGIEIGAGARVALSGGEGATSLGVRPEHIRVTVSDNAPLTGTVGIAEHLGSDSFLHIDVAGVDAPICVRIAGGSTIPQGTKVSLDFDLQRLHLFDAQGERRNAAGH